MAFYEHCKYFIIEAYLFPKLSDITILSPQSLVNAHKESLRKALEQYQK